MVIATNLVQQPPTIPPGQAAWDESTARIKLMLDAVRDMGYPPLRFLKSHEAAELIGICVPTLRLWAEQGIVRCVKVGRTRRYRVIDLIVAVNGLEEERGKIERVGVEAYCDGDPWMRELAAAAVVASGDDTPDDDEPIAEQPKRFEP